MAGVKWYAEGVFHRETVFGKEMSAKHVAPLVPGALIRTMSSLVSRACAVMR
jgi:hypothetical protein